MDQNRVPRTYIKTFQTLKAWLQTEIEGCDDLIEEINQDDTYYLVQLHQESAKVSYFASIQIRSEGVYLQLHTFSNPSSFEVHLFPKKLITKAEPVTRSLRFIQPIHHLLDDLTLLVHQALLQLKRPRDPGSNSSDAG